MDRVLAAQIERALGEALGVPAEIADVPEGAGLWLMADEWAFGVEYRSGASEAQVGAGVRALQQRQPWPERAAALLVVPYMGEVGKRLCQGWGVSWLDLSGNAHITIPHLRVRLEGSPNRFKRAGRPASLFAPRSSRVARALLLEPGRTFTQAEIAEATGLTPGAISRLVRGYEEAGFVSREQSTRGSAGGRLVRVRVNAPDLLLDAWREAYDFGQHQMLKGVVPARSGMELLGRVATVLDEAGMPYAATGLASAWLWAPFAMFRVVTVYLTDWPSGELLSELRFLEEPAGGNLWLAFPKDEDVLRGSQVTEGVRHVSAVQTYLDLRAQPERAEEAGEELRRERLRWGGEDD